MSDEIQQLLHLASEHDAAALEARKAAGRLLAEMRSEADSDGFRRFLEAAGLDARTARLLLDLAAGGGESRKSTAQNRYQSVTEDTEKTTDQEEEQ